MGAPKQKWTTEEEAALKAGVVKHGAGKWRTILKDPEFSTVLCLRSNVDLKDKWRNMSVMANGLGSREKTRLALKKLCNVPTDENTVSSCTTIPGEDEIVNAKPLAMASSSMEIDGPKRSIVRLDNLILDAIINLKEHGGSNKSTIASYIEDQYWTPPNFKRLLSAKLKFLTACGKIVKVKRKYRVAPPSGNPDRRKKSPPPLLLEGRPRVSPVSNREEVSIPSKAQIDVELAKIRGMSPQDAAAAAARAVAEAEATIAEAEEAAREAEAAEADAEAAQAFAEAAMKTLKGRSCTAPLTMVRG